MGFGFIEVGTVTPKAQPGNPRPRMFRLPASNALINRLGFNNEGLASFVANVQRARSFRARGGIVGLNIGKNAATPVERAVDDYLLCLDGVAPHADYVTVNISSPNTKNLRQLQNDEALDALLSALVARRDQLATSLGRRVPLFLKIAPDLDDAQIAVIAATLKKHGAGRRHRHQHHHLARRRAGPAARRRSRRPVGRAGVRGQQPRHPRLRQALGPDVPIIGVGGVMSGADARAKLAAGADLVQIYTGLIYRARRW
jgi:dihydroorotate dehydrogenase